VTPEAARDFVTGNTGLGYHPLVPEITLYLATRILPIWLASEESLVSQSVEPPFWAFAWPGGAAMARHMLDHRDTVSGKRVLDLASGSGIAGIAAAMAGAHRVAAADIDPMAQAAITLNADANGVSIETLQGDVLAEPPPEMDVILAPWRAAPRC
jgi:predicted nicotinamide N-methyase